MRFENVCLESLAVALPDETWTLGGDRGVGLRAALRAAFRLPFGRLELMTGIRERRR